MNVIAKALFCAGMTVTGSVFAETFSFQGTEWDDDMVVAGEFPLEPGTVYAVTCRMRHLTERNVRGSLLLSVGDYGMGWTPLGNNHAQVDFAEAFLTAADLKGGAKKCTLRRWHVPGKSEVSEVAVRRATPSYWRTPEGIELGYGESIDGNDYHFGTKFTEACHAQSRPMVSFRRLTPTSLTLFGKDSEMRFAHELAGRKIVSAQIVVACETSMVGVVSAEISRDGKDWTSIGKVGDMGIFTLPVPDAFLPAAKIHTRLVADGKSSVRIRQYAFDAKVDGAPVFAFGKTTYSDASTGKTIFTAKPWDYLDDTTSGALLPAAGAPYVAWEQSSGNKVFKGRPLPKARTGAFRLAAARNEAEAKQLVLRSDKAVKGVRVSAAIEGVEVEIARVGYVMVHVTMDSMGARGEWPDPILPQTAAGCDLAPGANQPFWVKVKPRRDAAKGVHRGSLTVSAPGVADVRIPLEVEVFGFEFPDEVTCKTAFGLANKTLDQYHHLKTDADRQKVYEKYLEHFAQHHVAPSIPTLGMRPPTLAVKWTKPKDRSQAMPTFDWTAWDAAIEKAIGKYRFNAFRLTLTGLGAAHRNKPEWRGVRKINGVTEDKPLYETYMQRYLSAVEGHLVEKGWIDKAYVYPFDEPLTNFYGYMKEDFARVHRAAPKLRRMITMEPKSEMAGAIDLWCPITYRFDRAKCAERRADGEDIWWYVTFSSMPPHVNEHIEHAGVDMRMWLWQTWMENISGVLMWGTVTWHSSRLYPDRLQNPYEDSMAWQPRKPMNTGEGKYLYPPTQCFETEEPVISGPVDSIRFEMLREGLEDYEYFVMLKKLSPGHALLAVPPEVATSPTVYSTDPAHMENHRLKLARVLEKLAVAVEPPQCTVDALESAVIARDRALDAEWRAVADAAAFKAKCLAFKENFRRAVGYQGIRRTQLNTRTIGVKDYGAFRIEKVMMESAPGEFVPLLVFLPDAKKFAPPYAGFIFIPGHSKDGKGYADYLHTCELGARNGLAVVTYDPLGQGERSQGVGLVSADEHVRIGAYAALLGETTATYMIRDAVRVLDYFESRSDIDPARLGACGNSGGGTLSAFLMVADDRIKAATPSCYLSSAREHLAACGPQDAEQNFFGGSSWGFNHAALVLSAGCPVLINAAVADFFQIEGSRSTYRLVKDVAAKVGLPEGWYELSEAPGKHSMSKVHREQAIRFLLKHLKGEAADVVETATTDFPKADIQLTPDGKVSNLAGFRSVYDEIADQFAARGVSVEQASINARPLVLRELGGDDCKGVLATLKGTVEKGKRAVLRIGGAAGPDEATATLFAEGPRYAKKPSRKGKVSYYERRKDDEVVAVDLYLAGRSLVALRAAELLTLAAELKRRTGLAPELVAEGRCATVAKFAAAADAAAFAAVQYRNEPKPFLDSLKSRDYLSFADSGAIDSGRATK